MTCRLSSGSPALGRTRKVDNVGMPPSWVRGWVSEAFGGSHAGRELAFGEPTRGPEFPAWVATGARIEKLNDRSQSVPVIRRVSPSDCARRKRLLPEDRRSTCSRCQTRALINAVSDALSRRSTQSAWLRLRQSPNSQAIPS